MTASCDGVPVRASSGDQGSATIWSLCAGLVLLLTALAVLAWSAALVVRQRAEAAADLAALAGARALLSGSPPCDRAGRVAAAGGARLVGCEVATSSVSVLVEVPAPRVLRRLDMPPARARARAGGQPSLLGR